MDFLHKYLTTRYCGLVYLLVFWHNLLKYLREKKKELIFLESQCLEVCQVLIVPL